MSSSINSQQIDAFEIVISESEETFKPPLSASKSFNIQKESPDEVNILHDSSKFQTKWYKRILNRILDSYTFIIWMVIVTMYALVGDDIRLAAFPKSADSIFYILSIIALSSYAFELFSAFIAKVEYRWSFYFLLDVISTLSLFPDIGWVWDPITVANFENESESELKNAGEASMVGLRASQILRMVRLIRLIRFTKLYKSVMQMLRIKSEKNTKYHKKIVPYDSSVGIKLFDLTSKRVIGLIIALLILIPLFEVTFFVATYETWNYDLETIEAFMGNLNFEKIRDKYISLHKDNIYALIYLEYDYMGVRDTWQSIDHHILRDVEAHYIALDNVVAIFDMRAVTKLDAFLSILKTVYICLLLFICIIYFNKDSHDMVLVPITKMLKRIKSFAKVPIKVSVREDEEPSKEDSKRKSICCYRINTTAKYETHLLEGAIKKIWVLLMIGLGEAGSNLISYNMENNGDIDLKLKGTRTEGIFGSFKIMGMSDAAGAFQENIVEFINKIAMILHGDVHQHLGIANRYRRDSFLTVWKFDSQKMNKIKLKYLSELALLSFVKSLKKIYSDQKVVELINKSERNSKGRYDLKIGMGLHTGWAIEGAIGSEYKADATYVSKNVDLAFELNDIARIYDSAIFMSEKFYENLSPQVQKCCRHIDTVIAKGTSKPINLYTIDVDLSQVRLKRISPNRERILGKRTKWLEVFESSSDEWDIFRESKQLKEIKQRMDASFANTFKEGLDGYIAGDWDISKIILENALRSKRMDGPTLSILKFMESYNFKAPSNWNGFRVLNEINW